MSKRPKRRPKALDQSIHWKPIRDSHYVVASLQLSDGGRRPIFVQQQVLSRAQASARGAHGRRTFGLLMGQVIECSVTGTEYMIIDGLVEHHVGPSGEHDMLAEDSDLGESIEQALAALPQNSQAAVLGWYRVAASVEAKPSPGTASLHALYFGQPWQAVLVLADGSIASGGAFFLHDSVNSRWFHAPFYELESEPTAPNQPKTTCIQWPHYMTADEVVLTAVPATPGASPAKSTRWLEKLVFRSAWISNRQSSLTKAKQVRRARWADDVPISGVSDHVAPHHAAPDGVARSDVGQPPLRVDQVSDSTLEDGRTIEFRAGQSGSPFVDREVRRWPTVDDANRRSTRPRTRVFSDDDDTSGGDSATTYIELARTEGFFVASKFDAAGGSVDALWVLNEPYSGLLLTVVTSGDEVVDANLHYNVRTDEAGLLRAPFPEHRDPDSMTIYVRETCVDGLRERCRLLRATNALVREWKVCPSLSFLTPAEWQSPMLLHLDAARAAATVVELNQTRISQLPAGVRDQFGLARANSSGAPPAV